MCGRYLLTSPTDSIRNTFGVETHANIPARYNIAPSQVVLIVRNGDGTEGDHLMAERPTTLSAVEWGLVPHWSKERPAKPFINARSETAEEKPSFRAAFKRQRCLIPANGWYEWRSEGGKRQPYLIAPEDGELFAFAGIWSLWQGPGGDDALETCAILTEAASGPLAYVHGRKPVIVTPDRYADWLQVHDPLPRGFLASFPRVPEDAFQLTRVSTRVNAVRFDDPDCITPQPTESAASPASQQGSLF